MVKNRKLNLSLVILLITCFVASIALFVGSLSISSAAASITEASTQDFRVEQGASVRTNPDKSGIRFTTFISDEYYATVGGDSAEWHTLIGYGVENVADITKENMATNSNIKEFVPENNNGEMQLHKVAGGYKYYTVIYFDLTGKTEQQIAKAFSSKINARSYVSYNDGADIAYTDTQSDSYRSVSEVAEKVLIKDAATNGYYQLDGMKAQKEILQNYIVATQKPIILNTIGYAEDMYKANDKTITGIAVADGTYSAKFNGVDFGNITVVDGTVTIPVSMFPADLVLGEMYSLTLIGDKAYVQNIKYVSGTIDSQKDFVDMVKFYKTSSSAESTLGNTDNVTLSEGAGHYNGSSFTQRYYVLTQDVTFTEDLNWGAYNTERNGQSTATLLYTLWDIFDGQGYTLKVGSHIQFYGLIPRIGKNAKVMNLGIDANQIAGTGYVERERNIFYTMYNATLENVSIVLSNVTNPNVPKFLCDYTANVTYKNVYLYVPSTVLQSGDSASYLAQQSWGTITCDNVLAITSIARGVNGGSNTNKFCGKNEDNTTGNLVGYTKLDGVLHYKTLDEKAADTTYGGATLTHVGNWKLNADGTATWDKTTTTPVTPPTAEDCTDFFNKIEYVQTAYAEDMYKDQAKTLSGLAVVDGNYTIAINGVSVGELAVSGGVASVPADKFPTDLTLGEYYVINLTSDTTVYTQVIRYVSGIIDSQDDWHNMLNFYVAKGTSYDDLGKEPVLNTGSKYYDGQNFTQRYYVLTQDIIFGEIQARDANNAFFDIFDGQGFKLKFGNNVKNNGAFNALAKNSKLMNLGMELDCINIAGYTGSERNIIHWANNAILENVSMYLKGHNNSSNERFYRLIYQASDVNFKNVYIFTGEGVPKASDDDPTFLANYSYGKDNKYENVVAITKITKVNASAQYLTSSDTVQYNSITYASNESIEGNKLAGITRYATMADKPDELTHVGNWKINSDGTTSWVKGDVSFDVKFEKSTLAVEEKTKAVVFGSDSIFNGLTYVASSNNNIVKVNADNTIEGVATGSADVKVAYQIGGEVFTKTITVTVA